MSVNHSLMGKKRASERPRAGRKSRKEKRKVERQVLTRRGLSFGVELIP